MKRLIKLIFSRTYYDIYQDGWEDRKRVEDIMRKHAPIASIHKILIQKGKE